VYEITDFEEITDIFCPLCKTAMHPIDLNDNENIMCLTEGCEMLHTHISRAAVEAINLLIDAR